MNDYKLIKKIEPAACPHCNKDIFISSQSMPAMVTVISTEADIKAAKEEIKKRMEEIKFSDELEADKIINWLDNEETLLDRSDIETLIKQIQTDQLEKIQKDEKNKD